MSTTHTTTSRTADQDTRFDRATRVRQLGELLAGYETSRGELSRLPHGTNTENAVRAERLALVCARITGVWRLIVAHAVTDLTLPGIYRHAAVLAECDARRTARFWRDTAADWRARAEGRPTSDAAGALSNWHELGETA
jgi:hypothetical protein